MVLETALLNALLVSVGAGVVISGLAALSAEKAKFDFKKFLYTLGIATISGLAIIEATGGEVTSANALTTVVSIFGASFVGNKLFGIAKKLQK